MIWEIFLVVLVIWLCVLRWNRRRKVKCCDQFKNEFAFLSLAYKLLGNDEEKCKAFQALGQEAIRQGGVTATQSWMLNQFHVVIADPVVAELVLKTCLEKDETLKLFTGMFGNGLALASVSQWRLHRKTLNPAFSMNNLNQYVEIYKKNSNILLEKLKKEAGKGVFSIYEYTPSYAFDVICEVTFGKGINAQGKPENEEVKALKDSCCLLSNRMTQPLLYNKMIYEMTSQYVKIKRIADTLMKFINMMIKMTHKTYMDNKINLHEGDLDINTTDNTSPRPVVEILFEASTGDPSDPYIRDEVMQLLFAGTDTTSVAFSFTCLMLAKYPDVQEKVYRELLVVLGGNKRPIEAKDLPHMKYTEAVIKETMRLYPPGMLMLRKIDRDLVLPSGQTLVKGVVAMVHVWATHRNPRYWGADAEQFRPDRFLNSPLRHPAAYLAFSYGARNCIGYQFAMMSIKTTVATLVRAYRFAPVAGAYSHVHEREEMRTKFDMFTRDAQNFPVRLEAR